MGAREVEGVMEYPCSHCKGMRDNYYAHYTHYCYNCERLKAYQRGEKENDKVCGESPEHTECN